MKLSPTKLPEASVPSQLALGVSGKHVIITDNKATLRLDTAEFLNMAKVDPKMHGGEFVFMDVEDTVTNERLNVYIHTEGMSIRSHTEKPSLNFEIPLVQLNRFVKAINDGLNHWLDTHSKEPQDPFAL